MSEQTEFTSGIYTFGICANGDVAVECNDDTFYNSMLSAEFFKELAAAQQRVVWATQHWTSLAQVNDALSSLLAVHPGVQIQEVRFLNDAAQGYYVALAIVPDGYASLRSLSCSAEVQDLFRQLNAELDQSGE